MNQIYTNSYFLNIFYFHIICSLRDKNQKVETVIKLKFPKKMTVNQLRLWWDLNRFSLPSFLLFIFWEIFVSFLFSWTWSNFWKIDLTISDFRQFRNGCRLMIFVNIPVHADRVSFISREDLRRLSWAKLARKLFSFLTRE